MVELRSGQRGNVYVQDSARHSVRNPQNEAIVENEHPRGQIGENAFQVPLGGFELRLIELRDAPCFAQLLRHAVERLSEYAQLVPARDRSPAWEITARPGLSPFGKHGKGGRQTPGQEERERDRRKQGK